MDDFLQGDGTTLVLAPSANLFMDFREVNNDWVARTDSIKISADNTAFLYLPVNVDEITSDPIPTGNVLVAVLTPENIAAVECGKRNKFSLWDYSKKEIPEELMQEAVATTGFLLSIAHDEKSEIFLVSADAVKTLAKGSGLAGDDIFHRSNLIRTMDLADAFYRTHKDGSEEATAIYRTEQMPGGTVVKKIFAVLSAKYKPCPASVFNDAVKKFLGDENLNPDGDGAGVSCWAISHRMTTANVVFTKAGEDMQTEFGVEVTPGIQLQTSDVGESSMTARGVLYGKSGGYVTTDEVAIRHSNKLDAAKFQKDVDEKIFAKVRTLPEKLAAFMGISLYDPDLSDAENVAHITELFDRVYWECANPSKAGKEKVLQPLHDAMVEEIQPGVHYTAYDIAMMFLDAPDRAQNISDSSLVMLRRGFGLAPFELEKALKEKKIYLI